MEPPAAIREIIGYVALLAAIVDVVAVVVWFQRGDRKRALHFIGTGIVFALIFCVMVLLPDAKESESETTQPSTAMSQGKAESTNVFDPGDTE